MKSLGNQARLAYSTTPSLNYSPSAKKTYAKEVAALDAKLNTALKHAPLERRAQIVANSVVSAKKQANPDMDSDDLKKVKNQALAKARADVGGKKTLINVTDREWEAIQSGAITNNKLTQIIANTDLDRLKERATPRTSTGMPAGKLTRAKTYLANGYTQSEVADMLGVSLTTLNQAIN